MMIGRYAVASKNINPGNEPARKPISMRFFRGTR